jgi:predicted Holliday junction resolvase-like endonuclease|tara:strand:+ start:1793 stop:2179 length:387 start_codon:yes stop_codon:yes gene_type:complete
MLDLNIILSIIILLILFILFLSQSYYKNKISKLQANLKKTTSDKMSLSTKYGQISEEFFPLEQSYPYNSKNFKFLGNPIDGIQFNEDKIILIEFKTNSSKLSTKQRHIRNLINDKQVEFELIEAKINE